MAVSPLLYESLSIVTVPTGGVVSILFTLIVAVAVFPTKSFIVRASFVVLLEICAVIDFLSVFGTYSQVLLSDTILCNGSFAVIVTFTLPFVVSFVEYVIDWIVGLVLSNSTAILLLVAYWCAVELDLVTIFILVSLWNILYPIEVTLSGIITLLRFVQFENIVFSIDVVLPGISISVKLVQSLNVIESIAIILSGKFTLLKLVQPPKVDLCSLVTLYGIVICVRFSQ